MEVQVPPESVDWMTPPGHVPAYTVEGLVGSMRRAVTQTERFRAAVAGAGISNWQSYYGQNRIDQWLLPYFGASVYDDPAIYARSSPIPFIKNV